MEDNNSFEPLVVIAVGLGETEVANLREECAVRRHRLMVAATQADLPLSPDCDIAIINALLPDGDGRDLAVEFARRGARVQLVDNVGEIALHDAWILGATTGQSSDNPADTLDELSSHEHLESVSRAGRLIEALRLADSVKAAAAFSASSGIPVSFVRIRPRHVTAAGTDETLDRLTSVVGMTTVFLDAPHNERLALVVNADRRRLVKLLDDQDLRAHTEIAIVTVQPEDDLSSLMGRSLLDMWNAENGGDRSKILVALAQGQEKTVEKLRLALHRMELSPLFWSEDFSFGDLRSNHPIGAIVDLRKTNENVSAIIAASLSQDAPVPVLAIAGEGQADDIRLALEAGASDFLQWPFESGAAQSALARVITVGGDTLKAKAAAVPEPELEPEAEVEIEVEPVVVASDVASEPESPPETNIELVLARLIAEQLSTGEAVNLEGLGILNVRHETSRIVHDSQGRTIVEPPSRAVTFSATGDPDTES